MGKLYDALCDLDNLYVAYKHITESSGWKYETQIYGENLLFNLRALQKKLLDGSYKEGDINRFFFSERGKVRCIESRNVEDRVLLRCLNDNVIMPCITKYLQYDNSASLEGRGTQHFRRRLDRHLKQYYNEYGNDGYILIIDFRKFFDNIEHEQLKQAYAKYIDDEECLELINHLIDNNVKDVSYLSDEEFEEAQHTPFNAIEHYKYVFEHPETQTGEKLLYVSTGIGSQLSQSSGILYPTPVDNYVKIVRGEKYYGRYMDDLHIIHHSKKHLYNVLKGIRKICKKLGIYINDKKTQIINLKHKFTILQTQYVLRQDGYIVHRNSKTAMTRQRRKLKKQGNKVNRGLMPYLAVEHAYKSWRGTMLQYNCKNSLKNMDKLYDKLFIEPFIHGFI